MVELGVEAAPAAVVRKRARRKPRQQAKRGQ
jgi:hypothetical protein